MSPIYLYVLTFQTPGPLLIFIVLSIIKFQMAKEKDTLFLAKNWKGTFPMIISTTADPKLYNNSSQTPSILSDGMKELCVYETETSPIHPSLYLSLRLSLGMYLLLSVAIAMEYNWTTGWSKKEMKFCCVFSVDTFCLILTRSLKINIWRFRLRKVRELDQVYKVDNGWIGDQLRSYPQKPVPFGE